jgi:ribonuclease P protein component
LPPLDGRTVLANPAADRVEVGFAVGRRIGNAVTRNRIRRRLRAIIAAESEVLVPGLYLIGVKNDRAATISHEDLRADLRETIGLAVA